MVRTAAFSSALRSRTSFSAELSLSVSSISLNCLHSSRQPRSETARPPLWSSASSDGAAPTRGRPSPRSARRRSSSWRASCMRTTTRRRSSRRSGTTTRTAGPREAQVGKRVLTRTPVWPTYITNGFFSWRFAMPASRNAARRGKLTAGGIASRVALYDSCGIMEMNSAQNTKRTRFEHLCPRRVRTIKMAPRVGFEPTTLRLTAGCSAVELPRNLPISCALSERAR